MSYHVENRSGKRKTAYRVKVIIKQGGHIVYRDTRTFGKLREATSWGAQRDKSLKKALNDPEIWAELTKSRPKLTIGELIHRYQVEYSSAYGRTVGKDLDLLARSELAKVPVGALKSGDIVAHIKQRVEGVKNSAEERLRTGSEWKTVPVSTATAANELTRLQTVLDAASASWNTDVPRDEIQKARIECRKRRMVSKAKERSRVATEDELKRLRHHFEQATLGKIPMGDIIGFAIYSCRRQDEITQLRWADNDPGKADRHRAATQRPKRGSNRCAIQIHPRGMGRRRTPAAH